MSPEIRTFGSAEKPEDCGVELPEVTTCRGKFVFDPEVFMMFNTSHILSGLYINMDINKIYPAFRYEYVPTFPYRRS